MPIMLFYNIYQYFVFRGKVTDGNTIRKCSDCKLYLFGTRYSGNLSILGLQQTWGKQCVSGKRQPTMQNY